jgi:hypothetical protein
VFAAAIDALTLALPFAATYEDLPNFTGPPPDASLCEWSGSKLPADSSAAGHTKQEFFVMSDLRTLRHPDVLQRPNGRDGFFTFDLARDGRE